MLLVEPVANETRTLELFLWNARACIDQCSCFGVITCANAMIRLYGICVSFLFRKIEKEHMNMDRHHRNGNET
jgi:hypothetical protein